jgi:predicted amidophosphoribosyltransferase
MKISEVEFGSLLTYSPHGNSVKEKESKAVMINLKNDNVLRQGILTSEYVARAIKKDLGKFPFSDYFNSNAILIPAPKSSLLKKGMLWVPQRITTALINNGLGKTSEECLERVIALPRSSKSTPANRPKPLQHYESMRVKELLFDPNEIVLVDDVVTRGATILGAVNRLTEVFPNTRIRAFAVMRTMSNPEEFSEIVDPCIGTIRLSGKDAFRNP